MSQSPPAEVVASADPSAIARLLEEKLSGIPRPLHQEDFNALKEILELLETEDSPRHGRLRVRGETARDSDESLGPSGSDSDGDTGGGRASIETRLKRLCSYIDEDWEAVIENYFTGFNYCIKSFSRLVLRDAPMH